LAIAKRKSQTKFITEIVIDGKIDESVWQTVPTATDYNARSHNGTPIPSTKKNNWVLYDNDAVYIAALLYDDEPNKIMKEISARDDFGASDVLEFSLMDIMTVNKIFSFL
jgi:hypothetical protein